MVVLDKSTIAILRQYLKKIERFEEPALGAVQGAQRTHEEANYLLEELRRRVKANNLIVYVLVALYVSIFILAVGIIVLHISDEKVISSILGGSSLLSLLAITAALKHLWEKKMAIDFLLFILPIVRNNQPENVDKLVEAIYFWQMQQQPGSNKKKGY